MIMNLKFINLNISMGFKYNHLMNKNKMISFYSCWKIWQIWHKLLKTDKGMVIKGGKVNEIILKIAEVRIIKINVNRS